MCFGAEVLKTGSTLKVFYCVGFERSVAQHLSCQGVTKYCGLYGQLVHAVQALRFLLGSVANPLQKSIIWEPGSQIAIRMMPDLK